MAFVYRSDRENSPQKSNPNLGPGAYIGINQYKQRQNTAPFNRSSRRVMNANKTANFGPGPGTYSNSHVGFESIQQASVTLKTQKEFGVDPVMISGQKMSSNFASKVPRFAERKKVNNNLGPGRYVPEDNWIQGNRRPPKPEFHQILGQRPPHPPSIPSHDNVFGYEETKSGELKRQKNPEKVITGLKEDRVGPGQYNLPGAIATVHKGALKWK